MMQMITTITSATVRNGSGIGSIWINQISNPITNTAINSEISIGFSL